MRNTIMTKNAMDIKTAVDYTTQEIQLGALGIFIDTEFGTIPVEITRKKPTFDYSTTCRWDRCPVSKWVMSNRNGEYDWYVGIYYPRGMDPMVARIQLIKEFSSVMFRTLTKGLVPDENLLNALTREYISSFHHMDTDFTRDKMVKMCVSIYGGIASKISSGANRTIKDGITRMLDAQEIVDRATRDEYLKRIHKVGFKNGDFGNSFYDLMASAVISTSSNPTKAYNEVLEPNGLITAYQVLKCVANA